MSDITLSAGVRQNLLSLQKTADLMATTQNRLATGKKVNSALDNPSNFFTAASLQARSKDLSSLLDSMSNGIKTLEAADNGLTAITKTVESMQSTLRQARQDKSFKTETFEVSDATKLSFLGGADIDVSDLGSIATPGVAASLSTSGAPYTGPAAATSASTVIDFHANMTGQTINVAGTDVDLTGAADAEAVATAISTALGLTGDPETDAFTVVGDNVEGTITITTTATGSSVAAPAVDLGGAAATAASVTFTFDPDRFGGTMDIDGQTVNIAGNVDDFVTALQGQLGDDYTVSNDGNDITVTSNTPGAGNITVGGLPGAEGAKVNIDIDDIAALVVANDLDIGGNAIDLTGAATLQDVVDAINGESGTTGYTAAIGEDGTSIDLTSVATGSAVTAAAVTGTGVNTVTSANGLDAIALDSDVAGADGASISSQTAGTTPTHEFTVAYGNKTANISVVGGTESEIVDSINAQLADAGIAVTASIEDGVLSLTADKAEAKVLAISGPDAAAVFGADTMAQGSLDVYSSNAKNTVDRFVEVINNTEGLAGKIRASNDNGKLRIENLSTQELSVTVDNNGDGTSITSKDIGGNEVRAGLVAQFNELRDTLDKLADDASFNGINLLRGDNLRLTFNETGTSTIDIRTADGKAVNAANLGIDSVAAQDFDSDETIDGFLNTLKEGLDNLRSQASAFGSNLSIVQNRTEFTKSMMNTLQTGADALVLADSNEEAANMLALQTRQQLSSTALSLASQADQAVLRLF